MAPARTGKDNRRRIAVIFTDHTKSGIRSNCKPSDRILIAVVMKLIAPRIEDAPAKCNEKIAKSTEGPACARFLDNGGYTVHPVPTPFSTVALASNNVSDGGRSQNLILFIRGNAISGAPNINGTSQFPNPPIKIGITIKKIIRNACAVTIVLYNWSLPRKGPG